MFQCRVCDFKRSNARFAAKILCIDSKFYLVENIPVTACANCGDEVFSRVTTENILEMLYGEIEPNRSIPVDVFACQQRAS